MGQRAKPVKRPSATFTRGLAQYPTYCSFCFKARHAVKSLVAGPGGVFICDACVGVCSELVAGRAPAFPAYPGVETLDTNWLLALLAPLETKEHEKNSQLRWLVETLRSRNVSWAKIGKALGMSRQSAWERFSKLAHAAKPWRLLHVPQGDPQSSARER